MRLAEILERLDRHDNHLYFQDRNGVQNVKSFRDAARDVALLVDRLRHAKVASGSRIGILAANCYEWIVWDLACVALECVSVAFEQVAPSEPLTALIDRFELTLLAVEREWLPEAPERSPGLVALDDLRLDLGALRHCAPPEHPPGAHSLAFSSGTTGRTKGLIIGAAGTDKLCTLYWEAYGVVEGDRFLTFLPFANFQQRATYYFCLYYGLDFVAVPLAGLFPALRRYKPTFMIAPPMFYETLQGLVHAGRAADAQGGDRERILSLTGGGVRYMVTGMAPIRRATLEFFWRNGISLYEAFGVTEAGMVTWNKPGCVKVGTVGTPAEPGTVTLADDGEVVVTRDNLWCLGYFDAPEDEARATFVGPQSVATGDIAAWDDDGFLVIVGRKKDAIVTKGGEKFLPEPIEAKIEACPAARLAVIVGGDEIAGVTAIIVIDGDAESDGARQLRGHVDQVNQGLPVYQQVKRIVFTKIDFTIENGLRTRNLKLNRRAIKANFAHEIEAAGRG